MEAYPTLVQWRTMRLDSRLKTEATFAIHAACVKLTRGSCVEPGSRLRLPTRGCFVITSDTAGYSANIDTWSRIAIEIVLQCRAARNGRQQTAPPIS